MKKEAYQKQFTKIMQGMKIYRPDFDYTIKVASSICELRDRNLEQWKERGYEMVTPYKNKAGAENLNKSPFFLNNLQFNEQLLKYLKALGLTPADASRLGVELVEEHDDLDEYAM